MAGMPPYINAVGAITKVIQRIAEAQKPERFTQDYLATVLQSPGGSARPIIPLFKRIGFLNGDGSPTSLYTRLRNPSERPAAMLEALKRGYPAIFARNEFAHLLQKEKLKELVIELSGLEPDNAIVRAIVGTFVALCAAGGVSAETKTGSPSTPQSPAAPPPNKDPSDAKTNPENGGSSANALRGVNLSYTINLNLPATTDTEVFNAIFRALKEHLLEPNK